MSDHLSTSYGEIWLVWIYNHGTSSSYTRVIVEKPPDPEGTAWGRRVVFCDKSMVTMV